MSHGKHIKVRLYGVEFGKLKDAATAERFLVESVDAAGMRPLDDPWVYDVRTELERQGVVPNPDEPEGVTGIVVLSTSHVAIHTWPHRGYANIDVYSCRDFETDAVLAVAARVYGYRQAVPVDLSFSLDLPPLEEGPDEEVPDST